MVACRRPKEGGESDPLKWIVPSRLRKNYGVRQNFTGAHVLDNGRTPGRMLKKARLLTRPTLAAISPARPESAKTASSPRDSPCTRQGRYERLSTTFPVAGLDEFPTAHVIPIPYFIFKGSLVDPRVRASNEHILIVRVPRAGGRPGCPSHPSEAARCVSTGIVPATPPLFQHPARARGGGKGHSRSCRWDR